jgi:hypothetical protein
MFHNRIRTMKPKQLPALPMAQPHPAAFAVCPVPAPLAPWQQELYAKALAEAQAVARPSLLERDLLGVWN